MPGGPKTLDLRDPAVAVVVCGGLLIGAAGLGYALWSLGLSPALATHGALMIAAWGVLLPAGAIVARYFKVPYHRATRKAIDDPVWWWWHRVLQYAGITLATVGLAAILSETGGRLDTLHGTLGLVVMALAWLQIASAAMRGTKGGPTGQHADPRDPATWRGDHYDMSRRRVLFERWHKPAGWAVTVLASVTLLLGIALIGAPTWLLLAAALLQGTALLTIVDAILRARWVDTYQALWGHDPAPQAVSTAPSDSSSSVASASRRSDALSTPR